MANGVKDMRIMNVSLVVCIMFSLLLSGCVKRKIPNMDSQGDNVICFGNSITLGYGAEPGEDYPTILSKLINMPVINAGVDGDTSTGGLGRIEQDVLEKKPLLVIVEVGGNDFLKKIPMDKTISNVKEIVDKIHAKRAMVAIADVSAGLVLRDYRIELNKIAKEKNTIFIPGLLSGIITNPELKSDFLHPNVKGYNIIAQRVHQAILPYIKRNMLLRKSRMR